MYVDKCKTFKKYFKKNVKLKFAKFKKIKKYERFKR